MRVLFTFALCFAWFTSHAQTTDFIDSKIGLHTIYLPQFNVQETSDSDVRAYGVRWMFSDFNNIPWEIGFQAYSGFGDVSRLTLGINLAYRFAELQNVDFKVGLGLNRIDLKDYEANEDELGPQIGDVSFDGWGTEFKPYLELEWTFSRFSSLFMQAGYHIINGEKSEVTAVEPSGNPIVKYRATEWDQSFFYSASGLDIGIGISISFNLKE